MYSTSTAWTESTVTWNTAPPAGVLLGSLGAVSKGVSYDVDVTPLVTGDGSVAVRISSANADEVTYQARENTVSAQLFVELGP